jgi:hypothetical protein
MSDKISVPLKEYVEINAARPCLDNIALPGMNFVFAIRSRLTAKTILSRNFAASESIGGEPKMITYEHWVLLGLLSLGPLISQKREVRLCAAHRIVVGKATFMQGHFGFDYGSGEAGMHFEGGERNGSRKSR